MTNSKSLRVTEFDFDDVKANLKTFLRSQTEFKDYDFEGSGINILLDTLAYNTHYLGFNANMLANEMFLDSASLRSSVVSHAKTLGYEVSSCRAPIATLSVTLTTNNASATMPSGTTFTTTVDDTSYQFVTVSDITQTTSGGKIIFTDVPVYEGTYIENINFSGKDIVVIGESRENTIIDGNQDSSVVIFESGETSA